MSEPIPNEENLRAGADVTVTVSSQLITTSLALLAVTGAFVTFTLDKRDADASFYIIVGLSAFLSFLSGVCGSIGMDRFGARISAGQFRRSRWINAQTILLGLSIFILPFSFLFFGTPKEQALDQVQAEQRQLTEQLQSQEDELQRLQDKVDRLETLMDKR
jgi:hypothetical protein